MPYFKNCHGIIPWQFFIGNSGFATGSTKEPGEYISDSFT